MRPGTDDELGDNAETKNIMVEVPKWQKDELDHTKSVFAETWLSMFLYAQKKLWEEYREQEETRRRFKAEDE